MHSNKQSLRFRQAGSALLVSLLMILIITILSLATMNNSMMQQRMAANFQAEMEASEYTQSIIDAVIDEDNFYVKDADADADTFEKYTICFSNQVAGGNDATDSRGNPCNDTNTQIDLTTVLHSSNLNIADSTTVTSEITQFTELSEFRAKEGKGSSAGTYVYTPYEVRATYDDTVNSYGRSTIVQGYIIQVTLADDGSLFE